MNLLQSFSKPSFNVQATYGHRQLDKGCITSSEGFFKLLRRIHMVVTCVSQLDLPDFQPKCHGTCVNTAKFSSPPKLGACIQTA